MRNLSQIWSCVAPDWRKRVAGDVVDVVNVDVDIDGALLSLGFVLLDAVDVLRLVLFFRWRFVVYTMFH